MWIKLIVAVRRNDRSILELKENEIAKTFYEKEGFICISHPEDPMLAHQRWLLNVSSDNFPNGNVVQRYPKVVFVTITAGICALLWLKKRKN